MISESQGECFVYITLPGATEPVTAGRFALRGNRRGVAEGHFVYGRTYLARADAVPLDPVELKLTERTYATTALNGVFGALRDASPDYWGRRVIQRHLGVAQPSELDYLLYSPDDRAGALGFGLNQVPPAPKRSFNQTLDLARVQATADAILADEDLPGNAVDEQINHLLLVGTSMGGARPKAVVEDDAGLWIAKFNVPTDPWNNARIEHAMLTLARICGVTTANSRVVNVAGRDVLLVKRFDRDRTQTGYRRARMISALTLLRADDAPQTRARWSYVQFAEEVRRACTNPAQNAAELFRRMCFNALISNIDDHPRNHALIARDRDWSLSPAYDLTPAVPVSVSRRDLAMECGDAGRFANAGNLLSQSMRFLMERDEAAAVLDAMEEKVRTQWFGIARECGVTPVDCDRIAGAFVYPGFRASANEA
ncbi:MAG: type II toxin-antitoxin system HipA family toxin [Gammaproteobacteria bacterium]|nr:type II toxin-antitoxin system HipA family toxin [Gammaproteobacteria bacterium]MBU1442683.1 type II toxin-antitoxin system HipA family toxin [Gammaproteobacteria bacterium]MBU2286244.1 type II toxin-antitoxin system HipA family toxin [Gammaproteobacteria bacterium]MBU2409206.1 type II toxin-antitoxin system HipA family toxin [Gammaproteobacteria bacterium]